MVKLWDARHSPDSAMLATLSGHKQAVNKVREAYPAEQTPHVCRQAAVQMCAGAKVSCAPARQWPVHVCGVSLCKGAQLSLVLNRLQDARRPSSFQPSCPRCSPAAHPLPCQVSWNLNGTWLASCSRDFTVKVWDVRHSKREMVSWQGHQGGKDITAVAWHPIHLDLLASSESRLSKVPAHLALLWRGSEWPASCAAWAA